jgi:hypothetical protein
VTDHVVTCVRCKDEAIRHGRRVQRWKTVMFGLAPGVRKSRDRTTAKKFVLCEGCVRQLVAWLTNGGEES